MTDTENLKRAQALDRLAGVLCAAFAVVGLLMALAAFSGCATGLDAAQSALPKVADGVHLASTAGMETLHVICQQKADTCRENGVTVKERCPGWLKCNATRDALEDVTRAVEDDLIGLKSKIEAFRKVQTAIQKMKEE